MSAFAISAIGVEILGGFNAFIMAAIGATLGTLFVHIIINSAFPSINKKFIGRFGLRNILLSSVSIAIFLFIFGSTFIGVPNPAVVGLSVFITDPVLTGSLAFVLWTVITVAFMYIKRRRLKELKSTRSMESSMDTVSK